MSAWIVSEQHITAMLTAGLRFGYGPDDKMRFFAGEYNRAKVRELTLSTASEVGQMLWAENYASVNHRYEESGEAPDYDYPDRSGDRVEKDPVVILKLIDCYEYQSCEHDGWATSKAKAFCDALRSRAINKLPGYDAAPWGL